MVSYLALMSSFEETIENWNVSGNMFAFKVIPVVPRMVTFLMTGSLYRRSNLTDYVKQIFIPCKLMDVEIITGYFSYTRKRVVLSTNMHIDASHLNERNFDFTHVDREHNNGNMDAIIKSIESTTNIPYMLPPLSVSIGASNMNRSTPGNQEVPIATQRTMIDERVDYGIHSPSPLTFMKRGSGKMKKVIYFSPINLRKTYDTDISQFIFINLIQTEITRLSSDYHEFKEWYNEVPLNELVKLERYLLVIYTTIDVNLNIVKFTSLDAKEYVRQIKNDIVYRLYS